MLTTETILWDRARAGEPDAMEELSTLSRSIASSELRRRGLSFAEVPDLAQESVRSTLAYLSRGGDEPKDLRAFLKFRAWGVLSDHRKKMRADRLQTAEIDDLELTAPEAGPDRRAQGAQMKSALAECRASLSDELRKVLELRYEGGLEAEAIVQRMGIHRNTVHVRVFRALEKLRECLVRKGYEPGDLQ